MLFTPKFIALLSVAAASAYAAVNASPGTPTSPEIAGPIPLSVILYDHEGYLGSSYSPEIPPISECHSLPAIWLNRAESVKISAAGNCLFFRYPSCAGDGEKLSGNIPSLPSPLYDHVGSFLCIVP